MYDVKNAQRAEWAYKALQKFASIVNPGAFKNDEDHEDLVMDLICDLRHYCDAAGFVFDDLVERSYGHYVEELREELE